VAQAVALSKLDYCNSLLCGAFATNIDRPQKVKISLHGSLLDLRADLISHLSWPLYIGFPSGSESSISLHQLPTERVPEIHHHIFRASYRTTFQAALFVLLPAT